MAHYRVILTLDADGMFAGIRTEKSPGCDDDLAALVLFNELLGKQIAKIMPVCKNPMPVVKEALQNEFGDGWGVLRSIDPTPLGYERSPTAMAGAWRGGV